VSSRPNNSTTQPGLLPIYNTEDAIFPKPLLLIIL